MENRSLDDFLAGDAGADQPDADSGEESTPQPDGEATAEPDGEAGEEAAGEGDDAGDGSEGMDAGDEGNSEGDGGDSKANGGDSEAGPRVPPGSVEPATVTYAVGSGECVACGEVVRERWRGEAGLVCPDCKEW